MVYIVADIRSTEVTGSWFMKKCLGYANARMRVYHIGYKYVASQSRVKASMERKKGQQIHDLQ